MASYRCYLFDVDDHILSVDSTDLPDDDAAIRWGAALLVADRPCVAIEVWQLARRVCRLQRAD
jgi:hypothetical protein